MEKTFQVELTEKEIQELEFMIRTQIDWGTGGCYGDGEEITDKKGLERAKKILIKLSKA